MQKNYSGSLALTKLVHVKFKMKGKSGNDVEGLFIPIDANYLVKGKPDNEGNTPIYMPIRVITKSEQDQYGQNGFVSQSVDSKKGVLKKLPILGNIKDFSGGGNDATGAASDQTFDEDSNDLPF